MERKTNAAAKLFDAFNQFSKLSKMNSPVKGLKTSEIYTLFCIKKLTGEKGEGVKVSQISNMLDVTPPTVTQLINGLEKKDCIERQINIQDRRAVQIRITDKGQTAVDAASNAFYNYFQGLVEFLGEEKSNQLSDLLVLVLEYSKKYKPE
ncbi:MAG TPA: MarR family winged helix-turn-helix transcriptional regulator [Pseudobacteroides sp.]|uniref:MarR family winged helix-turn-helix transcriptional regulator n=1 Tax=Pseudobacteroides sp. TaxID=1968840 RepID=UPI002F94F3C9